MFWLAPKEVNPRILLNEKLKMVYFTRLWSTLKESGTHYLVNRFSKTYLLNIVLKNFLFDNYKLFKNLQQRAKNQNRVHNHVLHLIRVNIGKYSKVWVSYCCSQATDKSQSVRQFFNHLIHFKGQ